MIVPLSSDIDLGLDGDKIKRDDADRQQSTSKDILKRLFPEDGGTPFAVQMLADEVGMGKTFVALAVAYSILQWSMTSNTDGNQGTYRKIIILTPDNDALFTKWGSEVNEFIRACIKPESRAQASAWFKVVKCYRLDEIVREARRTGTGPTLILAKYRTLNTKLTSQKEKQRFTLGAIFKWSSKGINYDERGRILRAASEVWEEEKKLTAEGLSKSDQPDADVSFTHSELGRAFDSMKGEAEFDSFIADLKKVASTWSREERKSAFEQLTGRINDVYREACSRLLQSDFPLVIVDEAHNWRNGNNNYEPFRDLIARHTKRLLLLTATPFQLQPLEMLNVLEVHSDLHVQGIKAKYGASFEKLRGDSTSQGLLQLSIDAGERFVEAWSNLPRDQSATQITEKWRAASEAETDTVKEFVDAGRALARANRSLSAELSNYVIRHRRETSHRLYLIGSEFGRPDKVIPRADRHLIHAARGFGMGDSGALVELAEYVLMRAVEAGNSSRRTVLGPSLTSCFSILFRSADGKRLQARNTESQFYVELLHKLIGKARETETDAKHPKLAGVTEECLKTWRKGEKVVVFCIRPYTAARIRKILGQRIQEELDKFRNDLFKEPKAFVNYRKRLSDRTDSLAAISFDHTLQSYLAWRKQATPELTPDIYNRIAELVLSASPKFSTENPDMLRMLRAFECATAASLLSKAGSQPDSVLLEIASNEWLFRPYGKTSLDLSILGFSTRGDETIEGAEGRTRGLALRYYHSKRPSQRQIQELAEWLKLSPKFKQTIFGPSLMGNFDGTGASGALSGLSEKMWRLTMPEGELQPQWDIRFACIRLVRRAFLRPTFLLRILANGGLETGSDTSWLVRRFYEPLSKGEESLATKLELFLSELAGTGDPEKMEQMLISALSFRDPITVVHGETKKEDRTNRFFGFNSPLLPEILICTSVGQEGINLHRFCSKVIHYDLPFNPATLEQRTGRIDRIGSKTFRDRDRSKTGAYLEVEIPYLAGTYDERIFDSVRTRAQTFEVITGGDLASDVPLEEEIGDSIGTELSESKSGLPQLPEEILSEVRVDLSVFRHTTSKPPGQATAQA